MSTLGQLTDEDFAATKTAKRMQMSAPDASAQRTIAELLARIEQLEKGRRIEDRAACSPFTVWWPSPS